MWRIRGRATIRHNLEKAFELRRNLMETGSMLPLNAVSSEELRAAIHEVQRVKPEHHSAAFLVHDLIYF